MKQEEIRRRASPLLKKLQLLDEQLSELAAAMKREMREVKNKYKSKRQSPLKRRAQLAKALEELQPHCEIHKALEKKQGWNGICPDCGFDLAKYLSKTHFM